MEHLVKNPGLQHISQKIFMSLDYENLSNCQKVNLTWKTPQQDPFFWLKKCIQHDLLKEHQNDWINIIKTLKNSEFRSLLTSKLATIYKNKTKSKSPMAMAMFFNIELFEKVAMLTKNPNAPFPSGLTPIYYATQHGLHEKIRILAPLVKNPNAPNPKNGFTPIQMAARKGDSEIIKILVPFCSNPNRPDPEGATPIYLAAEGGTILLPIFFMKKIKFLFFRETNFTKFLGFIFF